MKIFYFTGTGNSLAVAKRFDAELISIPQIINNENIDYNDEVIGIIYPTYCFTVPKMVLDFVEKANLNADFVFAIATCGGGAGSAPKKIHQHAEKHNLNVNYSTSMELVDNYLPLTDMNKSIKKYNDILLDADILNINKKISSRTNNIGTSKLPIILTDVIYKIMMNEAKAQKFKVTEKCNLCKTCQKVCPTNNIDVSNIVTFKKQCANCFACIHLCPQNAIHLKNQKSEARWINPSVSLKEIIMSNNQN